MRDLDKYYLQCVEAEKASFSREVEEMSRALWPSPKLVKMIKRLLNDAPELSSTIDGPAGAVSSLKAAARGNEHARRVRKLLIRSLVDTDTFELASRRVLKNWIVEWAHQDMRWQRAPIRFYPASNAMAPCVQADGNMCNRKDVSNALPYFQFDATWLWGDYCVYAWHRWANTASDIAGLPELQRACNRATQSIYKDREPRFLIIIHGPASEPRVNKANANGNTQVVAPWEITQALARMAT